MRDYIERNRLKTVIEKNFGHGTINPILQLIDEQPTADVQPVVNATWYDDLSSDWVCTNCLEPSPSRLYKYCPNCGARMGVK